MYRVWSSAVGALTLVFALPAAAHAAPPECPDASFTIAPGEVLQFQEPVCDDPEGNPYQVSSFTDPPHGTLGGTPDAGTYTPDNGFHGRDEFTYTVKDSTSEISQPATVRILVDTAPTCADGSVSTQVNQTLRIPFPCEDADGDGLFIEWSDGDHGVVDFDGTAGEFVYTPDPNYVGPDSFIYAVRDDWGLTSGPDRTTTIDVKPAPLATVVPAVTPTPAAEGPDRAERRPQDTRQATEAGAQQGLVDRPQRQRKQRCQAHAHSRQGHRAQAQAGPQGEEACDGGHPERGTHTRIGDAQDQAVVEGQARVEVGQDGEGAADGRRHRHRRQQDDEDAEGDA